jgi:hypothetical protein
MKKNKKYWKKAFKQADKDWTDLACGHVDLWERYDDLQDAYTTLEEAYKDTGNLLTEARDEIDSLKQRLRDAQNELSYTKESEDPDNWTLYYARHPERRPRHARDL